MKLLNDELNINVHRNRIDDDLIKTLAVLSYILTRKRELLITYTFEDAIGAPTNILEDDLINKICANTTISVITDGITTNEAVARLLALTLKNDSDIVSVTNMFMGTSHKYVCQMPDFSDEAVNASVDEALICLEELVKLVQRK